MAVWADLVVSGTYDSAAPDAHRRLRLEHRRSFRAVALADGAPDIRRRDRVRLSAAGATVYPLAIAGSAHRHAGAASGASAGNTSAGAVVPGFGPWRSVANSVGLTSGLVWLV